MRSDGTDADEQLGGHLPLAQAVPEQPMNRFLLCRQSQQRQRRLRTRLGGSIRLSWIELEHGPAAEHGDEVCRAGDVEFGADSREMGTQGHCTDAKFGRHPPFGHTLDQHSGDRRLLGGQPARRTELAGRRRSNPQGHNLFRRAADWIGAGGLLNGPSHLGLHPRPGPEQPNGARLGIRSADRPRSPAERGCDCGRNGGRIIIPIGVDRCAAEFDDTQRRDRWQMNNLAERG